MMRKISCLIILVFSSAIGFAQHNTLTVNITGINEINGDVYIYLYASEKGFPINISKASKSKKVKVTKESLSVSFKDVAPDIYAVSVYHDIDGNEEINQNFLGIPKEPVGVSNNATGFMGPPKYEDAIFKLQNSKQITINLKKQ